MNEKNQHIKLFNKFLYCVRKYGILLDKKYVVPSRNGYSLILFKVKSFNAYNVNIFYFDILNFYFKLHAISFYPDLFKKIIFAIKFP